MGIRERRVLCSLLEGWLAVVGCGCTVRLELEVLLRGSVVDNGWLGWWLLRKVWLLEVWLRQRCCWQGLWRRLLLKQVVLWWVQGR